MPKPFSKTKYAIGAAAIFALAGCASAPEDIAPAYVSPVAYGSLSCGQIAGEMQRVSLAAQQASGVQQKKRTQDKWLTAATIVVFWPAAFFTNGDGANAAQVARLKGEMQALQQAATLKRCKIKMQQMG
ncbi:MAG: hypothetical protein ACR2PO_09395 [Methyloligellaceae bacterium]